jgi:hypothetical protein
LARRAELARGDTCIYMADAINPVSTREKRLGGLSVICISVAAIGPVTGANVAMVAVSYRAVFLVAGLVLGIAGRRTRAGKIGMIGSGAAFFIMMIMMVFLVSRPAVPVRTLPALPAPSGAPAP